MSPNEPAPRARRNPYGRFAHGKAGRKPPRKVEPRTDLTHVYYTHNGERASLQGMRCKILVEKANGRAVVEFEKGQIEVVRMHSLKGLPGCGG